MRSVLAGIFLAGLACAVPAAASAASGAAGPGGRGSASAAGCRPWAGQALPDDANLTSVVAFSPCDVWAAGGEGRHSLVVRWNGRSWGVLRGSEVGWPFPGEPVTIGGTAHDLWLATVDARQLLLVEHWNGIRFAPVALPLPAGTLFAQLHGISAVSSADIWAVGIYAVYDSTTPPDVDDNDLALTEHWNGRAWSVVPAADPSKQSEFGGGSNVLESVSARTASDAWAVGTWFDPSTDHTPTLIEHWNGAAWTQVPSPSAAYQNNLTAVSADSAADAWAVGFANGLPSQALTEHWNGTAWRVVPSLDPGRDGKNRPSAELTGVSALSPSDVWAVGSYTLKGGGAKTLLVHWNGRSWRQVATPVTHRFSSGFNGLSAPSARDIWAVGGAMKISGAGEALVLHHG